MVIINKIIFMNLIFEGRILNVGELIRFTSRNGTEQTVRVLVVQTEEQHANSLPINVFGELATLDYYIGQLVRMQLNCKATLSTSGKWFARVSASKLL